MMALKRPQCLYWAAGLLLLVVGQAQSPRYTFNPSNYVPPAGQAPLSTSLIKTIQGNSTQFKTVPLDTSNFYFKGAPISQFPGVTFTGNKGCSPHAPQDSLSLRSILVPTLEAEVPAIRTWRNTADGSYPLPMSSIYLDLQNGNIILGTPGFNWTQQARFMNYTFLTPNLVDLDQYQAALHKLTGILEGLATGMPPFYSAGSLCNDPIPALNETWTYLLSVEAAVSNSSNVSMGLRPTEIRLQSGCIEEIEANYKGDLISDVLPNTPSGDDCCQSCRNTTGCNVWVWCPLTSGCATGTGAFPYLGCQLKYQANVSTSAQPQPLPDAWSRGPPTGFVSGRLAYT